MIYLTKVKYEISIYHLFNVNEDQGFVIITGENNIKPNLKYTFKNNNDPYVMRTELLYGLGYFKEKFTGEL